MDQLSFLKPESGWIPPKELPDLSNSKIISFDVETHDPNSVSYTHLTLPTSDLV